MTHLLRMFSVRAPRMSSFSATLWNILSFNLHKIVWIMFQNEILVQVSTDGTLLPVNENKNNHEIDLSLWLEIYSFSGDDSFTRNASGISGPQTPSERCFKNLPLKHAMKESPSICTCLQLGVNTCHEANYHLQIILSL